jgi:hypothetical protein
MRPIPRSQSKDAIQLSSLYWSKKKNLRVFEFNYFPILIYISCNIIKLYKKLNIYFIFFKRLIYIQRLIILLLF